MKKILFLLLVTISSYAQTYQNPTFGTVKSMTAPTVSTTPTLGTIEANGTISKIVPNNVPITYTPINYAPSSTSIADQLAGIDTRLGQIGNVTAGVTTRVHLTGDNITVTAGTFFASNTTGKGATAAGTPQQTLSNNDDQKQYFTKDVMSVAVPALTTAPPGVYSGQLTVTSDPTPGTSKQRFTIEIYKCNNGGTPIASGITGAPVGNLGVTVVAILDSGLINVVASALTNIGLQGNLASTLTLNTGERLRYHISAEKVGTDGGAVTMNVYYGTNYNSYYDIPVTFNTDGVLNKSTVVGATATDALNALNTGKISGTGTVGQVSFWNVTNTQTGDNALFWDNTNKRLGIGNILPTAAIDATAASTNTYTSFLTGILPPQEFGRISNSHNSGGTDQYSSLVLRVTGNLGVNNALASISAIQPLAANGSSEMSLAVRSGTGQMFEAIRIGTATDVKINNLAGTGTRVVGVSSAGILTPLSADMVTGTGTANYISKWSSTSAQANSRIFDNATNFVGLNSTTPYSASMGQTLNINATGTDQYSTLELVGNTSVNGNRLGLIQFANNSGALGSAFIYATRENSNSTYGDLHFDVRGAGGYRSNAFRISSEGALSMSVTPATSSGSFNFLSWNTSTGVIEKAPLSLEFNATDLTVWNNGKGNVVSNTSFGDGALKTNSSGGGNTAIGLNALSSVNANESTAVGSSAIRFLTSGSFLTAVGNNALGNKISGDADVAVGRQAGYFISGGVTANTASTGSVFIGTNTSPLADSQTNQIVIGQNATGAGTNTATLGNTSIVKTVLRGVINYSTPYTVATLPAGVVGDTAYVTNALTPTYLATVVGGGAVVTPVFFNGSNWVCH